MHVPQSLETRAEIQELLMGTASAHHAAVQQARHGHCAGHADGREKILETKRLHGKSAQPCINFFLGLNFFVD